MVTYSVPCILWKNLHSGLSRTVLFFDPSIHRIKDLTVSWGECGTAAHETDSGWQMDVNISRTSRCAITLLVMRRDAVWYKRLFELAHESSPWRREHILCHLYKLRSKYFILYFKWTNILLLKVPLISDLAKRVIQKMVCQNSHWSAS